MKFSLNGQAVEVPAAETPLLYVLRNDLGLAGTRYGCGSGECGACYVLVDGRPMASCDLPVSFVEGKHVTTIEGLGMNAVQKALVSEQAAQCAYCISGIAISASALLDKKINIEEKDVREALEKHLCRCGSHTRIVRAVLKAAREQA